MPVNSIIWEELQPWASVCLAGCTPAASVAEEEELEGADETVRAFVLEEVNRN